MLHEDCEQWFELEDTAVIQLEFVNEQEGGGGGG